ncbi:endonuclease YncB(thermonuclease family) [Celeribacter halophilus]|uniref:Endonuclease YncB, thermonuclease family n=1 Tax=Celeribacter halophilus TaxID=576117 RepID=A0A1I3UHF8_9RHOB|nr:endonuclease YncB(thermonuclease family) [Celeribacter halophilus]SFJ82133.1 Endonuclease YncB, thermonuclease family [Celeribacter halophilus]
MHIKCVRLGKIPYVAALWVVIGAGVALYPFQTAEAVHKGHADSVHLLELAPIAQKPDLKAKPQSGAIVAGRDGALRIVDGDTLAIGEVKIRLHGIDAPEMSQSCSDMRGKSWACGAWSKAVLERLAAGDIACDPKDRDRYGRVVAVCHGASGDLNAEMVRVGAAYAYETYALDYVLQEEEARAGGRGLWRAGSQSPSEFRTDHRTTLAPETPPSDCAIKGNISSSGKIYHLPGGLWYTRTRINVGSGERWFCSEDEARAAGWRKAQG